MPDGSIGLVRMHGRVTCCVKCGAIAARECDWKMPKKKSGTCDAPLCVVCTTVPEEGKDLCPAHAQAWEQWKARRNAAGP